MNDCISRQQAIELVKKYFEFIELNPDLLVDSFISLPCVQPKTGKWIYDGDCYICNKCKSAFNWWADSQTSNYCPNCGARMLKEGE